MWSVRASFFDHLVAKCHALRIVLLEPLIGKMTEALEMMSSRSRSFSSAVHAVLLAFSYDFLRRHARFSGFAKLLEKRFDRQPCCAGILYECMRFLTGHYKVNAAEEFLSFGCFRTEHRLVSAYINRIINVAWCFGHGILLDPEAGILCPFQPALQGGNCDVIQGGGLIRGGVTDVDEQNRTRYDRSKLRYPSDLTDDEWGLVEPLIPPGKTGGGKRTVIMREVVNGLMYILSTGCQWRAIPKDLPPRSSVYDYFDLWTYDGTLERIHHALYEQCRERAQREASPTAAIIDSQSVKSAEKGGRALIRTDTMRARRSRARSGTFLSTH